MKKFDNNQEIFAAVLDALNDKALSQEELANLFKRALRGPYGKDSATMHNLGLLAARAGLKKAALASALDAFDEPKFYTAFIVATSYLENTDTDGEEEFENLLSQLARAGHIETRKYLVLRRFRKFGLLYNIFYVAYSIWLTPTVVRIACKDIDDPRLDSGRDLRTRS